MKQLGDMLRANPDQLRCKNTSACLELVKKGSFVYSQVLSSSLHNKSQPDYFIGFKFDYS